MGNRNLSLYLLVFFWEPLQVGWLWPAARCGSAPSALTSCWEGAWLAAGGVRPLHLDLEQKGQNATGLNPGYAIFWSSAAAELAVGTSVHHGNSL